MPTVLQAEPPTCAASLKVLADDTRLGALRLLMRGAMRAGEIGAALHVDQSLLSHHLQVLRESGLVVGERVGKSVRYRLAPGVLSARRGRVLDLGCCRLAFPAGG